MSELKTQDGVLEAKTQSPKKAKKKEKKKYDILFKKNRKGRRVSGTLNFLRIFVAPFVYLISPFRYYGNRKVKEGAGVYVCNHYRAVDPIYPLWTTWEGIHFLAKKSVLSMPFLKHMAKSLRLIAVNRDGTDVRATMDALKCLKNGEKISIFPEGTRNKDKKSDEMLPFKGGAAMMAIKAKAPIIPMAIYKRPRLFRTTHILIGEPFEFTEYYGVKMNEQLVAEADQKLRDKIEGLRKNHAEFLAAKKNKKKKNKA